MSTRRHCQQQPSDAGRQLVLPMRASWLAPRSIQRSYCRSWLLNCCLQLSGRRAPSWSTRPTSMSGGPSTNQHQAASFRPSIHCPFSSLLTSFVEVPFWFIWSDKPAALLVICLRTLKPADSELLLTCAERWEGLVCHCHRFHCGSCRYLTAPYIRVPLLLGFFADRERVSLLREPLLQASS